MYNSNYMDSNANFSSGQFFPATPISYSSQPSKDKKPLSKKILLILCGIFVAIALFLGVYLIIENTGTRGLKNAFNNFSNYLLYGKESSGDIKEDYVWGNRYYARDLDIVYSDDYKNYLNNLKSKYEKMYQKSPETFAEYDNIFWLFYYASLYPDLTRQEVESAKKSGEMNEAEVNEKVKEYYSPFSSSSNEIVKEYGDYKIATLLGEKWEEESFPDYEIEIFQELWNLKEKIYEK